MAYLQSTVITGSQNVLTVEGSGSVSNTTISSMNGNNGRLFEVTDDLSNSIFSANTIAGLPVIEAFADNTVRLGKYSGASGSTVNITSDGNLFVGTNNIGSYGSKFIVDDGSYTYSEIRGTSQSSLVLTKGLAPSSYNPTVELFNSGNFGIVMYNPGVVSSNYLIYYNAESVTNRSLAFQTEGFNRLVINQNGNIQPGADNAYSLGVSGTRWSEIWAANGTIQTSDAREKKDIVNSDLGLDFISKLRPVSYKWIVGKNEVVSESDGVDENGKEISKSVVTPIEGKRTHYGLIAQEVKELLGDKDFGGFIHDDETDIMGLRYDQFISPLIKAIQELKAEIDILKNK